jgi:integrative and conjugative element protein (TIGR02256 family)
VNFKAKSGFSVSLKQEVVQTLLKVRQIEPGIPEAGGVLLGKILVKAEEVVGVVAETATLPTSEDVQFRFGFRRARAPTQRTIDEAWTQSSGSRNYLGEWHTHPEAHPTPSLIDLREWARISGVAQYEQDRLIFVIVGLESLAMWSVDRDNRREQLHEVVDSDREGGVN